MKTSDEIDMIAEALVLCQKDLTNPTKDARGQVRGNPHYRFASLPAFLDHVRPVLASNGISLLQEDVGTEAGIGCTTRLLHTSGQWIDFGPLLLPPQANAQDAGSALTYARRYQAQAALGLAPTDEDDDGKRASNYQGTPTEKRAAPGPGESTAKPNTGQGSVTSLRDGEGAQAAIAVVASPPEPAVPAADGDPSGDGIGEGAPSGGSPTYLTKDEQQALQDRLGVSKSALVKQARDRFGERITRIDDITTEMAEALSP